MTDDYATDALVIFGILVGLVFIGGSALLNFRMGYGSANNDTDGAIYGGLAAAGDGLKALCPFVAAYGWKHRQWLAMLAASAVFLTFTAYSFTSSLGFSSQQPRWDRTSRTASRARPAPAARPVDQVSEGCAKNKPLTREACSQIATLKSEQLRAEEAERLTADLHRAEKEGGAVAAMERHADTHSAAASGCTSRRRHGE